MREEYKNFLEKVARENDVLPGKEASGILDNQYWVELLDKSVKFLGIVAVGSGDFKLAGILALLNAWIQDKKQQVVNNDGDYEQSRYYY
jgi:hypothetical protein